MDKDGHRGHPFFDVDGQIGFMGPRRFGDAARSSRCRKAFTMQQGCHDAGMSSDAAMLLECSQCPRHSAILSVVHLLVINVFALVPFISFPAFLVFVVLNGYFAFLPGILLSFAGIMVHVVLHLLEKTPHQIAGHHSTNKNQQNKKEKDFDQCNHNVNKRL
jgi:hypothetical protein